MATMRHDVLNLLRTRSASTDAIADYVGGEPSSVRRTIQSLRRGGHNIEYRNGLATLVVAQDHQTAPDQQPAA